MGKTRNPRRTRKKNERTCTCDKCGKTCNSTPDRKHRQCKAETRGVWR